MIFSRAETQEVKRRRQRTRDSRQSAHKRSERFQPTPFKPHTRAIYHPCGRTGSNSMSLCAAMFSSSRRRSLTAHAAKKGVAPSDGRGARTIARVASASPSCWRWGGRPAAPRAHRLSSAVRRYRFPACAAFHTSSLKKPFAAMMISKKSTTSKTSAKCSVQRTNSNVQMIHNIEVSLTDPF